jgi:opacity protein-like surface antigen
MRKLILSLAAAGSALALATPAAAQYYSQPYAPGYGGQQYGYNGYGHNNWGEVRALQARIDRVEWQIRRLDRRNVIRDDSADHLRYEADSLERRLHMAARNGLNPYEAQDIRFRIDRIEQRVRYAAANSYGRGGYGYNGYNAYGYRGDGDQYGREHQRWHENHDNDRDDD